MVYCEKELHKSYSERRSKSRYPHTMMLLTVGLPVLKVYLFGLVITLPVYLQDDHQQVACTHSPHMNL